jgi:hypothetical protein
MKTMTSRREGESASEAETIEANERFATFVSRRFLLLFFFFFFFFVLVLVLVY